MFDRGAGDKIARARFVGLALAVALLGGCSMPAPVASLKNVKASSAQGSIELLPLTARTLPPASPLAQSSFPNSFLQAGEFDYNSVGPGDHLTVRIWENGAPGTPGLFTATGGAGDVGELVVDQSGRIYIPYAGSIRVSGLSVSEIRAEIRQRLRTVIANPQVEVRATDTRSRLVSVQGAAAKGGSYPIERGRSRLSQILAEAAPDQKNPEMLAVTVRRDGKAGTVRLSDVYGDPQQDIALRPGDSIILSDVVENVTVLGATGAQGTIQIPKRDFTLIEALGEAKGLSPDTADPRAVFVLRSRPGVQAPPLVYQVDMRRPETIALANRFTLQPNDVVLVSNAPFAQTKQVLLSIAQAMASVRNAALAVP